MANRDHRMKASDVFRETNFLIGEKVSFEKALPEIRDLKVEIEESGKFGYRYGDPRRHFYNMQKKPGEYVDCSNTLCYNGGFSLGPYPQGHGFETRNRSRGNRLLPGERRIRKGPTHLQELHEPFQGRRPHRVPRTI